MPLHWPTFLTRTGSAVVFGAVMLVGLLWNELTFWALFSLIAVLCVQEYIKLTDRIHGDAPSMALRLAMPCIVALSMVFAGLQIFRAGRPWPTMPMTYDDYDGQPAMPPMPSLLPLLLFVPTLLALLSLTRKNSPKQSIAAIAGLGYVLLPCASLLWMRELHWAWPLILILCIWTNDTMAYIVGSLIGRTPFSPISPKKTWEGTAGGAILTIAGAATWAYFSEDFSVRDVTAVATCAAVFGTLGDLFESKLKRLAGVKDSGALMPGHGGALDRFDSLLVATPFAFCYLYAVHL